MSTINESLSNNVAIVWTSDLNDFEKSIIAAVNECCGVLPGFRFYIIGANHITASLYTDADTVIQKAVHMNKRHGWIPDPFTTVANLAKVIRSEVPERYDLIIAFTRSGIDHSDLHSSMYEYYRDRAGIISLDLCQTAHEYESTAALMLEHVLGHALRHDGLLFHCQNETCAMNSLESENTIRNLIKNKGSKPNLNIFCEKCQASFHSSSLWRDQPSVVAYVYTT